MHTTIDPIKAAQIKAGARLALEHIRVERRNDGKYIVTFSDDAPAYIGDIYSYGTGIFDRVHSRDIHITAILRQIAVCDTLDNAHDNALDTAYDLLTNRQCAEYLADAPNRCDQIVELIRGIWDFNGGTREIARLEIEYMFPRVVKALELF